MNGTKYIYIEQGGSCSFYSDYIYVRVKVQVEKKKYTFLNRRKRKLDMHTQICFSKKKFIKITFGKSNS